MCKRPYSIIKTLKIDMFSVVYLALHQGHKVIIRDLNIGKRFPYFHSSILNLSQVCHRLRSSL